MGALNATKTAKDLAVGDTVEVWWGMKRATVSSIKPDSDGRKGWKVAQFADGHAMTITPEMLLRVAK